MNYLGIDIYKRYSVLVTIDERGQELGRGGMNGNSPSGFANFLPHWLARAKWEINRGQSTNLDSLADWI